MTISTSVVGTSKKTKIKQYHRVGRTLRTETTIDDARDFGVGKRLCNLPQRIEIGFRPTDVSWNVDQASCDSQIGEDTFAQV